MKLSEIQPKAKMTAAQRRKAVEIARDVIAQLRLTRIVASPGNYLIINDRNPESSLYLLDNEPYNGSFKDALKKHKQITCEVCAIGSVYIGYINRFNNVTTDQARETDRLDMLQTLSKIFTEDQLCLMEAAFEGSWVYEASWFQALDNNSRYNFNSLIDDYYRKYLTANELLRAIMLNVIRHNGEFRLPIKTR